MSKDVFPRIVAGVVGGGGLYYSADKVDLTRDFQFRLGAYRDSVVNGDIRLPEDDALQSLQSMNDRLNVAENEVLLYSAMVLFSLVAIAYAVGVGRQRSFS
ncbi:MAG: hypothetical protein AAB439_02500 [Patescibacteria group bacterium]